MENRADDSGNLRNVWEIDVVVERGGDGDFAGDEPAVPFIDGFGLEGKKALR
jgi:hypothetical protein